MFSGAHEIPTSLNCSVSEVTVVVTYMTGELLCSWNEPLAKDAVGAQEAPKCIILRNVVPGFSHNVNSQLKLSSREVVLDFLGCIKKPNMLGFQCDG